MYSSYIMLVTYLIEDLRDVALLEVPFKWFITLYLHFPSQALVALSRMGKFNKLFFGWMFDLTFDWTNFDLQPVNWNLTNR
jgi:hypothetical protein